MPGTGKKEGLSADDIALIAAIVVILGDGLALLSLLVAKKEKSQDEQKTITNNYK